MEKRNRIQKLVRQELYKKEKRGQKNICQMEERKKSKEEFLEGKKKLRKYLEEKRKVKREKEKKELRNLRNEKEIQRFINKKRKKKEQRENDIKKKGMEKVFYGTVRWKRNKDKAQDGDNR